MSAPPPLSINLTAAIVAVEGDTPSILTTAMPLEDAQFGLPSGAFDPDDHRTLEIGLRRWVSEQTALGMGYVEQLYTFGDRGRHSAADGEAHVVSIGYLALTRRPDDMSALIKTGSSFQPWYFFFPWEDWRAGRPQVLDSLILPKLIAWAQQPDDKTRHRLARLRLCFGLDGAPWDEERVLERYELLYEAGLVAEAWRDRRAAPPQDLSGAPMHYDHRRILATAMSRLRGKLKYRPVVFELMPETFTLTALQRTVEAISGRHLHKQNFRRLMDTSALVEPTSATVSATGGRPARLFSFRREVVAERPAPGIRV